MKLENISKYLVRNDFGIYCLNTGNKSNISYPDNGNDLCFQLEDNSFWFKHRNHCIIELVKGHPPQGAILDVGGGNGFVTKGLLEAEFDTILLEPGDTGVLNARSKGVSKIVHSSFQDAGFYDSVIPAAGLFDVLEHIHDDCDFLREIHRSLMADGMLYLTVPSYNFLWSQEDVHAGHYRRYSLSSLSKKLEDIGFEIVFASYIFSFLPVPILFLRTLPWKIMGFFKEVTFKNVNKDHQVSGRVISYCLNMILKVEKKVLSLERKIPFGGSCLIAAKKRGS